MYLQCLKNNKNACIRNRLHIFARFKYSGELTSKQDIIESAHTSKLPQHHTTDVV